jgi:DnaK suppressor protein
MLTKSIRSEVAKRLNEKKKEIIYRSKTEMKKRMSGENRQTIGAGLEEGDCAFSCHSDYLHFRNLDSQRAVMQQIDNALDKISIGSYGICEECLAEIDEKRLKILPFATHCKDCQELLEERA